MGKNVDISVIIPAINEENYIHHSLHGLAEQTFKNFETIVVDGNSADRTRDIAKKYARVIIQKKRGMGLARNTGAKIAKGNILLFLDADTRPSKNLLQEYYNSFKDGRVVAATTPIYPLEKTRKRVALGYRFVSILFVRAGILFKMPRITGLNFAVRREAFDKVGGFNGSLITYEDWDLSRRIKKVGRIAYASKAFVNTSARRVNAWGVFGYFKYYVSDTLHYYLLKHAREDYEDIR